MCVCVCMYFKIVIFINIKKPTNLTLITQQPVLVQSLLQGTTAAEIPALCMTVTEHRASLFIAPSGFCEMRNYLELDCNLPSRCAWLNHFNAYMMLAYRALFPDVHS